MRIAYADPPYFGCAKLYKADPRAYIWDDIRAHKILVDHLYEKFPDGWALSLASTTLADILPLCDKGKVRVGGWFKTFASFKPNVNPGYCWEPVIFYGGRQPRSRTEDTVRDWVACPITLKKGLTGAKPYAVAEWIFKFLGAQAGDDFVDLFPGTNAVSEAWIKFQAASTQPEAAFLHRQ